jgi:hypothetical protein
MINLAQDAHDGFVDLTCHVKKSMDLKVRQTGNPVSAKMAAQAAPLSVRAFNVLAVFLCRYENVK